MKTIITISTFIILFLSLTSLAIGQTVITTLENESGDPILKSFDDGGFLLLGEVETGDVPVEGAGTRLMWYPGKAAFRAGQVFGSEWDEENIGNFSTAMGRYTTASGDESTAMGYFATASGFRSTAMGVNTTASGPESIAMGYQTTASGLVSTAMGSNTTAATLGSLSAGLWNESNQTDDNTLFVVGNGDNANSRSDALRLDNNGNLTVNSLTETSDLRLKTKIEPIGEATLDKLGSIEPVRYQFKNQQSHPEGTQIGLIAQQVQEHFPELVSENSSGYLSLSYSNLTTVLLKGLQEQQEEIVYLKDENREIKERLANLEQQNQQAGWPVSTMLLIGFFTMAGAIGFRFTFPSFQKSDKTVGGQDNSVR